MSPSFHVPPGVPITLTKSVEKREETTRNRPQRGLKGVCPSSLLLHEMSIKRNCGAYKCRSTYWALNYILRTLPRTMETNSAILMQAATAHERQKPQGNYMLTRMHVQHKSALRLSDLFLKRSVKQQAHYFSLLKTRKRANLGVKDLDLRLKSCNFWGPSLKSSFANSEGLPTYLGAVL